MPPSISGVSGTLAHGQPLTITGTGFGSKSPAAPAIWDDCTGTNPDTLWLSSYPQGYSNAAFNLAYRSTPFLGVDAPHSFISKVLCGCYAGSEADNADHGWRQGVSGRFTPASWPVPYYLNYKFQNHTDWVFNLGADRNYKSFQINHGNDAYDTAYNYINFSSGNPWSNNNQSPTPTWCLHDGTLGWTQPETGEIFGSVNAYNIFGRWTQCEVDMNITDQSTGFVHVRQEGLEMVKNENHRMVNVAANSTNYSIGPMHYYHDNGDTNYTYFADLYMDYSFCRVLIGNASTYLACTKLEPQIPSAWSSTSITVTAKQNWLGALSGCWLYVVDDQNVVSAGYALSGGGGGGSDPGFPRNPKKLFVFGA